MRNKFIKNTSYLTISQFLSLSVSALLILLLPKFMSVSNYGYWQLFILYSGYVGLFHFGYSDGLYIKLGGKNLQNIDNRSLSSQFILFFFIQVFFSILVLFFALNYSGDLYKQYVFVVISIYMLIENTYKLLSFLLLSTDNSIIYSKSVFGDKIIIIGFLIVTIFVKGTTFNSVVTVYIFARSVALFYLIWKLRSFFNFEKLSKSIKDDFYNIGDMCKLGIVLTISNILSTLILATGRLFVEHFWGIDYFAKISLAISLSMFVLAFISQISLVLYPVLCNMETERQKKTLHLGSILLGFITMLSFVLYFFLNFFIRFWLKNYMDSLVYLVYLFPIILFEVKTQVLYITYCKSLKKIKTLFIVNGITLVIAIIIYYIASSVFYNIEIILLGMLFSLMFRSILLNIYLYSTFKIRIDVYLIIEILFSVSFIIINKFYGLSGLLLYYILGIIFLFFVYKNKLSEINVFFRNINN